MEGKKLRRLKGLTVHEVSLVDQPAVPKAKFIIAKRSAKPFPPEDETEEEEPVPAEGGQEQGEEAEEEGKPKKEPKGRRAPSPQEMEAMKALRGHLAAMEEVAMGLPNDIADMVDDFGTSVRAKMKEARCGAKDEEHKQADADKEKEDTLADLEEAARRAVAGTMPS